MQQVEKRSNGQQPGKPTLPVRSRLLVGANGVDVFKGQVLPGGEREAEVAMATDSKWVVDREERSFDVWGGQ